MHITPRFSAITQHTVQIQGIHPDVLATGHATTTPKAGEVQVDRKPWQGALQGFRAPKLEAARGAGHSVFAPNVYGNMPGEHGRTYTLSWYEGTDEHADWSADRLRNALASGTPAQPGNTFTFNFTA